MVGSTTSYYVGAHYQVDNGVVTKYYFAGAQRVAMRKNGTLYYLLADHLGSTSLTTDTSGAPVSELRYKAWGEVRFSSGTTPTSYRYTGQREEPGIGLMFYNARWYDPYPNHMTQPDSIVPDPYNSQAWDRYAYALNNPLKYTDPTGHSVDCGLGDPFCNAGKYTPGGLMQLYKHNDPRLNKEIDEFLEANPDYNHKDDPFLGFSIGDNRDLKYKNLRLQYWQDRLTAAGLCENIISCSDEANRLFRYYDEHESVTIIEAVPNSINWDSVTTDAAGIPLSLIGANGPIKLTTKFGIKYGYKLLFLTGAASSSVDLADSVATGNPVRAVIDVGTYVPVAGAFFSLNLLVWDLAGETQEVPWIPPIDR